MWLEGEIVQIFPEWAIRAFILIGISSLIFIAGCGIYLGVDAAYTFCKRKILIARKQDQRICPNCGSLTPKASFNSYSREVRYCAVCGTKLKE